VLSRPTWTPSTYSVIPAVPENVAVARCQRLSLYAEALVMVCVALPS
jgi:hypothetical protein